MLTLEFKHPFDMLSEFVTDIRDQKIPESAKRGEFEKWLGGRTTVSKQSYSGVRRGTQGCALVLGWPASL